jgi:hypothetical protein
LGRIRSIRPEALLESYDSQEERILALTLPVLADREGRLQDDAVRIRGQVFPHEAGANVEKALTALASRGKIVRYSIAGGRYIALCDFKATQLPHPKEKPSQIPPPPSGREEFVEVPVQEYFDSISWLPSMLSGWDRTRADAINRRLGDLFGRMPSEPYQAARIEVVLACFAEGKDGHMRCRAETGDELQTAQEEALARWEHIADVSGWKAPAAAKSLGPSMESTELAA